MTVSDKLVEAAVRAIPGVKMTNADGYNISPADVMRAAIEATLPAMQAETVERCARFIETHAYTISNREPYHSLTPSKRATDDLHHATIAAAIRAMGEKP